MQRVVRCYASRHGRIFGDTAEAIGWARAAPIPPHGGGIELA
jgi:hypothetical protein